MGNKKTKIFFGSTGWHMVKQKVSYMDKKWGNQISSISGKQSLEKEVSRPGK